jgi:RNA polymerase sigma-70 factor (ECF subfamily)
MNTPLEGRALSFPLIRTAPRTRSISARETPETRYPSDEELMGFLAENDSKALELLFNRYSRVVLGIARRILRDHGEAEDVVQETFFRLFQRAKLFDPKEGTAKAWIVRIAFHQALDRKSYLRRRGFYLCKEDARLEETLAGEADLDQEVGAKLNRVKLDKAFKDLPELQRRTIELFYFEGLELREIGKRLGEPLGNVRHHFYRGLGRLRSSAFVQRLRDRLPVYFSLYK